MLCPKCNAEMQPGGEDRLDQCLLTYLPARKWVCSGDKCEETVVTEKTGEPYRAYDCASTK